MRPSVETGNVSNQEDSPFGVSGEEFGGEGPGFVVISACRVRSNAWLRDSLQGAFSGSCFASNAAWTLDALSWLRQCGSIADCLTGSTTEAQRQDWSLAAASRIRDGAASRCFIGVAMGDPRPGVPRRSSSRKHRPLGVVEGFENHASQARTHKARPVRRLQRPCRS
jgi:hypothetical protein